MAGFGSVCGVVLLICIIIYLLSEVYKKLREKSFKGELALITGGAGGLGRLLAHRLMKQGCNVIIVDIGKESIDETGMN
jgi:all-trans-retinol dehydrogenase (NAD+)